MEAIDSAVKTCFPRWRGRQRQVAVANLFVLARGLRPAVLWDFGGHSLAELCKLVSAVRASPGQPRLHVLAVCADAFLVDVPSLKQWLLCRAANARLDAFVDVSPYLARPSVAADIGFHTTELLACLDAIPEGEVCHTLPWSPGWCAPTVFGLMLGYPVVYYTTTDDHCLAGVELVVSELAVGGGCPVCAFSYPSELADCLRPSLAHWMETISDKFKLCGEVRCAVSVRNIVEQNLVL